MNAALKGVPLIKGICNLLSDVAKLTGDDDRMEAALKPLDPTLGALSDQTRGIVLNTIKEQKKSYETIAEYFKKSVDVSLVTRGLCATLDSGNRHSGYDLVNRAV